VLATTTIRSLFGCARDNRADNSEAPHMHNALKKRDGLNIIGSVFLFLFVVSAGGGARYW